MTEHFMEQGFVRLDGAFSRNVAERARKILWKATGCDPTDRSTWTKPVVWLGEHQEEPFRQAANTPQLHAAFDELAGKGRWLPRQGLGSFPVRFPSTDDTQDTGWHVDASFPGEDSEPGNFLTWRVNVNSRGRLLLMLFLFSDVDESNAPTRIRAGSHLQIARLLEPAGEAGIRITGLDYAATGSCPEVLATGEAGTVYLCHPFLVHAAQNNRGKHPRFMAQPPLLPAEPVRLSRPKHEVYSPVELAIRRGFGRE
ncbi:MAG TPA: phytanoyl-CoA dioxygenase family protein [Verrucomicrobiae bacterium]|nr:phytanoyl-CoA dioxygenase family protein [Verrucomicrobiae bacterium]